MFYFSTNHIFHIFSNNSSNKFINSWIYFYKIFKYKIFLKKIAKKFYKVLILVSFVMSLLIEQMNLSLHYQDKHSNIFNPNNCLKFFDIFTYLLIAIKLVL